MTKVSPLLCVLRQYQIRSLESQKRQQEMVLRRKTQEVTALRRLAKPMSERAAGRVSRRITSVDSGAELNTSTTPASSEPDSTRSVSSIIRHWNTKMNGYLGESERNGTGGNLARSASSKTSLLLCIYFIQNTVKTIMLRNIITI